MRHNITAAREIAEARTAAYSAALWADVTLREGADGSYATFPEIVRAAIVGRRAALAPLRGDLDRFPPPEFDTRAVALFAIWFLDYSFFVFSFEQVPVAQLFGADPVAVTPETGTGLAAAAARFLCGYQEEDADKRAVAAPLAALTIKESMWGSALPEEWI